MKNIVMQIIKYQYSYKSEKTCDKENDISNIVQNEYLKLFNLIYKICKEKYNEISRFETPENVIDMLLCLIIKFDVPCTDDKEMRNALNQAMQFVKAHITPNDSETISNQLFR